MNRANADMIDSTAPIFMLFSQEVFEYSQTWFPQGMSRPIGASGIEKVSNNGASQRLHQFSLSSMSSEWASLVLDGTRS